MNKLDILHEIDQFLEKQKTPKLTQEQTGNLNRPITSNKTECVREFSKEKPGPDNFTAEFHQLFKEKLIPIIHKLFPTGSIRLVLLH